MRTTRIVVGALALGATAALVAVVPRVAGTSWHEVVRLAARLDPAWTAPLAAVWIGGLAAYGLVLTGALPGLSLRRALALNLAGSCVANAVPGGGALSMGLTTAMARSWGFERTRVAAFLTVSTGWTAVGRLAVGLAGVLAWRLGAPDAGRLAGGAGAALGRVAVSAGLVVAAVAAAGLVVAGSEHRAAAAGRVAGRAGDRLAARFRHRPPRPDAGERAARAVVRTRRLVLGVSRRSWRRIATGLVVYPVLLVVLLDGCLRALGHPAPLAVVVAAVGAERVAATVPVTPGGAGVADLGVAAVLVAGGVPPAGAAAGALLYRGFTFALEIPVGAVVALGWAAGRRRRPDRGRCRTAESAA